ncbi:hypothetical protein ACT453_60340, partial [Bacillus sp. D-CC]
LMFSSLHRYLPQNQIPVDENYVKDFEEDKDISTYRNKCGNLFLQEGCAKENSYINQFQNPLHSFHLLVFAYARASI